MLRSKNSSENFNLRKEVINCCKEINNKEATTFNGGFNPLSSEAQILAQATCTALNSQSGWTFAVARQCSQFAVPCERVCANLSDGQRTGGTAGPLKSFNSLHIYSNEPFSNTNQLGLKVYKYNHSGGGCGPNYCCCTHAS